MQNTQISAHSSADSTLLDQTKPCIVHLADKPITRGPGEHGAFMLTSPQTAGRVSVAFAEIDVNVGPPPHMHANEDEIFLIQSGAFELFSNGELVTARAGDVAYLARGEAHRFRGLDSGETNRLYAIATPSGFENFMERWIRLFENGAPDMQEAVRLTGEYNMTLYPSDEAAPLATNPQSKIIRGAEQPRLSIMGSSVTVLLDSAATGGRYALVRVEGPCGFGPPPHVHENEDEMFMIEEGTVELTLGDEVVIAQKGDMAWAPRGYAHTFRLLSDDARIVAFITPGGMEQFFIEADSLEASGGATISAFIDLNAKFGMTFSGH